VATADGAQTKVSILLFDFAIAAVGLLRPWIESAAMAKCKLKAVASCLLDYERGPRWLHREKGSHQVVDLDELQEIGEDKLLRPIEPSLMAVKDLYARDLQEEAWISSHLYLQAA
jgi:hypothetical protein